jgi:hypothetical protein
MRVVRFLPSPFLILMLNYFTDSASLEDPNELSFSKGEILGIINKRAKWWQAETENGIRGSMSYLLTDSNVCLLRPSCSYTVKLCSNCRQDTASEI